MSSSRYPKNWKQLALAVKESANWQCQRCGRVCLKPGETLPDNLKRRAYVLQVHHWNLDPGDNRLENLVALCSSCHLAYHCRSRGNISPGQLFLDLKLPENTEKPPRMRQFPRIVIDNSP